MGWTRNYYNLLTAFLLGDTTETSVNTPVDYQPPIVIRKQNGDYTNIIYHSGSSNYTPEKRLSGSDYNTLFTYFMQLGKLSFGYHERPNTYNWDTLGNYIQFGTGSTAADYEDYQLESPITSGLSMVQSEGTLTAPSAFDAVTHKYSSTRTFTINNTSDSSITLSELGIFSCSCLVYREVLATPITIDPGESVTVSFTREATVFNYTPYT